MVVALGINVGNPTPDAALFSDGDFVALSTMALPLRTIIEATTKRLERPADRLALSYPAWWDSLRVDHLLRDVRATDVMVDRYLTSGEAAVRWWRHLREGDERRVGRFLVHEIGGESSGLTLVEADGLDIETISSLDVTAAGPPELAEVAREMTHAASLPVADLIAELVVDTGGADAEHAVAFGTALAAML